MFVVAAEHGLPIDGPPLSPCSVACEDGRIVAVQQGGDQRAAHTYDSSVIVPAWVNVHTHLEFSEFACPLEPGQSFAEWIRAVVRWRQDQSADFDPGRPVVAGFAESQSAGVTAFGEIATSRSGVDRLLTCDADGVIFWELLGLSTSRLEASLSAADAFLQSFPGSGSWRAGLSPHAPYTIGPGGLARSIELAARHGVPLAMHLAESVEELELLQSHSGPLHELLEDLDAWDPGALPRGLIPLDFLQLLARAPRSLVIHGNYLHSQDFDFIGRHRDTMRLVYCPRTHLAFGHPRYPLDEILEAGLGVAVGTDSRASNPDLRLLEELRLVSAQHPAIDPAEIVRLGTLGGAQALGMESVRGSLAAGKTADFVVIEIAGEPSERVEERLLQAPVRVRAVYRRGERVFSASRTDT